MRNICRYVIGLFLLVSSATPANAIDGRPSVIDGDTLEIRSQRIRLYGIDAPESSQLCYRDGKPWRCGQQAAFALATILGHHWIKCIEKDRDRYKRIVAVCYVAGDRDLNARMAREGWALAYRRYSQDYVSQEDQARKAGAGIWAGEFVAPWDWRHGKRLKSTQKAHGPDKDCSDFPSWNDAQTFYEAVGPGDPHRLDGDKDGIACESLR